MLEDEAGEVLRVHEAVLALLARARLQALRGAVGKAFHMVHRFNPHPGLAKTDRTSEAHDT